MKVCAPAFLAAASLPPAVASPVISRLAWLLGLCCLLLRAAPCQASDGKTDSLLRVLDQTLARQPIYDQQRLNRLAVLKAELRSRRSDEAASFDLALFICDEYQEFKYDSAFAYSLMLGKLARRLHSPEKLQTARTKLAHTLRSAGLFKDAFDTLKVINVQRLEPRYQAEFYEVYSIVCIELAAYDQDSYFEPLYKAQAYAYADSAARKEPSGSYVHLKQLIFKARQRNDLQAGAAAYARLLRLPLTPHQVAVNASSLAIIYQQAGQPDKAAQLMTVAAINDIKSATKEGIALFNVSSYCYRHGDLPRAYRYITAAKEAAVFFRARQRLLEMSPIAARIDGEKIISVEHQRQQARNYAWAIGLMAALVLGLAVVIYLQLRRLRIAGRLLAATNQRLHGNNNKLQELNSTQQQLNDQLQALNRNLNEANHIKEEYIGYYFSNASRYVNQLEALQNKLSTLLKTKQVATAQRLVEDIDIKAERIDLFKRFDTGFIRLFPGFVADFNALFPEADRIVLPDDQLLTTELRIFALIRLGITDSEQISRILGYSIHTVYAYKTKVKNRSFVPNEAFEAKVLAI
ncbi:DUF6377 domain-containing protein [Hymenobacter sp. BT770]|uniref:DUF6377 domain-containing protein n=1 Tax=Hymenobacter sp. BT770 TaxID=2886942 RepID=UPI001D12E884|nr:DUF6377 domain-containing protein [Hymenobacter sp. BT770]MCC3153617.1 DUF6377 domain-containing protein [Hymenobacter sp. BT770]MDO3415917.1 DUF6377 domain-containing protein [Hymenobacter sp. BT770]